MRQKRRHSATFQKIRFDDGGIAMSVSRVIDLSLPDIAEFNHKTVSGNDLNSV